MESEENKIIKLLTHVLEILGKNTEKLDKLDDRINLLTTESKKIPLAKKMVDDKRFITKKELQEELELKTWKGWQALLLEFQSDKNYNIHTGIGRAPTIIVSLKNHNSSISLASKIFNELKKGKQIDVNILQKKLNKDEAFCKEVMNSILHIFPERTKKSQIPPFAVKKLY